MGEGGSPRRGAEVPGRAPERFPGATLVIVGDVVGIGYHFLRAIARQKYDVGRS
jgi:hypothetical protein